MPATPQFPASLMCDDHYRYWETESVVARYELMTSWHHRYRSERFFLERAFVPGMTVLDVGCATGGMYHALKERFGALRYTGIDVAQHLIHRARQLAPEAEFINANILRGGLESDRQFDICIATGLFQHEPESRRLLDQMLHRTADGGYVLFDVKLFYQHSTLRDIRRSYCAHPHRIYFIVFRFAEFMNWLTTLPGISQLSLFGYYSGVHRSVRLPSSVNEPVLTSHVLLKKAPVAAGEELAIELQLPRWFITNCFPQ